MIDPNQKEPLPINARDVCFRAFELIASKRYTDAEKLLAANMSRSDDDTDIALYHSVMGVLFKIQGEYKTAWKHYQRAEKLMPKDPALKIISARLLIDQFSEYEQAVKRARRVLDLTPDNPVFTHQAYTTMGLAYIRKGDKKKAVEMLKLSLRDDFKSFISAKNIDFELLETMLKRETGIPMCRTFLVKAKAFAESAKEQSYVNLIDRMLAAFDKEYPLENEM